MSWRDRSFGKQKRPSGDLVQAYSGTRNVAEKVSQLSRLLSGGADPNVTEPGGHPLLQMAVNDGHLEVVRLLLKHDADVNATNPTGSTALHVAAGWDDGEMVELLLEYKADVNARNDAGRTPLDSAELAGAPTETATGRPMRGGVAQILRGHGGKKGSDDQTAQTVEAILSDPKIEEELVGLLRANQFIRAIKRYRTDVPGTGLKDGIMTIERIADRHGIALPDGWKRIGPG